jgi:hypothetical protein
MTDNTIAPCNDVGLEWKTKESIVRKTVVGFVDSYGTAQDIVRDLENVGIVGAEVEVVNRVEGELHNIGPAPTTDRRLPNYIGAKIRRFVRGHMQQARAMVIVRTAHERTGDRAADILRLHGAKSLTNNAGPTFVWENEQPLPTPSLVKRN